MGWRGFNRGDLLAYVAGLDEVAQRMFHDADRYVIEAHDTLSEEFQIAADIVTVFDMRARRKQLERGK